MGNRHSAFWGAAVLALLHSPMVQAQNMADRPWAEVTADDLHFVRAILRENHPGPVDDHNPQFRDWYVHGFDEAIELASRATDRSGHHYALKYYLVGFQDGHLGAVGESGELMEDLPASWPGFIVDYNKGFQVAEAEAGTGLLPGDQLVSCDGRMADALGQEILGTYVGLWSVEGARSRLAPLLFVDQGNPYTPRPQTCMFERGEDRIAHDLVWREADPAMLKEKINATRQTPAGSTGISEFENGALWVSLPSFDLGDSSTFEALQGIIDRIDAEPGYFRNAPMIVFDVRGNTGGSSAVGKAITSSLWGEDYIQHVRPLPDGVDWRLSDGNARFLRDNSLARYVRRYGEEDARTIAFRDFVDTYDAALATGEPLLSLEFEEKSGAPADPENVEASVYLLTDGYCGSACLDFADILVHLDGVVHVGQETSADTIYIDNRAERLPSGEGLVGFSMKVYRGRPRGHNESHVPEHVWDGDISDTAALQRWIVELERQG